MIGGFPPGDPESLPSLEAMLRRYAEAITPWAKATALRMIDEVNNKDLANWRSMGDDLSLGIRKEILSAPVGDVMRDLMDQQVELITSIPLDAAQRVHELTIKGLEDSTRYKDYVADIMRSGDVAVSRAILIARTESSRAQANLTQARAQHIGSEGYLWRTSHDGDVRKDHRILEGRFFNWNDPPIADQRSGARAHPGTIYNCRCWAYVLLND